MEQWVAAQACNKYRGWATGPFFNLWWSVMLWLIRLPQTKRI